MSAKTPQTLAPLLHKLQRWTELGPEEQAAVLSLPHGTESVAAGRYLVREGDQPSSTCLLLSGFAYRHKIVVDGSRSIVSLHMKGDFVDLQHSILTTADHNVQMLTDGEVATIPKEAIRRIAFDYPKIGVALWYDTLVDGSIFREWIANVGRRDAATRLAHLLCEFAVRIEAAGLGNKLEYELPMTQEQLADATGLTAVHVNRTLRQLEEQGDIKRNVRHVSIADWSKIRKTADFRATYLHLPAALTTQ